MLKRGAVFLLIICLSISIYGVKKESNQTYNKKDHIKAKYTEKNHFKKKKKRLKSKLISKEEKKKIRKKRRKKLRKDTEKYKNRLKRLKKKYKIKRGTKEKPLALIDEINGKAIYQGLDNAGSTKTISADIAKTNASLTGSGIRIGVWDGGKVLETHQEFYNDSGSGSSRVSIGTELGDAADYNDHATHVAGTITATGIDANAKGFSTSSTIISYDFNDDISEMTTEASDNNLLLSNHSYGLVAGWEWSSTDDTDCWWGDTSISTAEDHKFGKYIYSSYQLDNITYANGNYTVAKAAGNDRGDDKYNTTAHAHSDDCSNAIYTDSHGADGGSLGYDSITGDGGAKNIITVGAANEMSNGWTGSSDVTMSTFSGWGPMDDGRIKPDIVAKGVSVYSASYDATSNSSYISKNGTSMATPAITGAIGLLLEYQTMLDPSTTLLSSTIKAILLHTADEAGPNLGPDYQFGWGLANIHKAIELMERNSTVTNNIIQEIQYSGSEINIILNNVSSANPMVITAVWTDPPFSNYSDFSDENDPTTKTLVNDIDISVEQTADGSTTIHYPWSLSASTPENAATSIDKNDTDNIEQIYIESPTGNYTLKINHSGDLYNNEAQALSLIIDYVEIPTITIPESTSTGLGNYTLSGTSVANSAVQIYIDGSYSSTTTSSATGQWSETISLSSYGDYIFQAVVTENINTRTSNEVQEIRTSSNILTINAPDPTPEITNPDDSISTVRTKIFYIEGTGAVNSTVTLSDGTSDIATTSSNSNGFFTFELESPLSGSTKTYTVSTTLFSITKSDSKTLSFNYEDDSAIIIIPENHSEINDDNFSLSGTAATNVSVYIYKNDDLISITSSNENGDWTSTLINQNTTTNYYVKTSISSSMVTSNVITIYPTEKNIPVITSPENLATISTPYMTISGTATPNSTITITFTNISDETTSSTTTSDSSGNWTITQLSPIANTYFIEASSNDGITTLNSEKTKIITNYNLSDDSISIQSHSNGSTFTTTKLTISGISPNGILTLYVDSIAKETITVTDGTWSTSLNFTENKVYDLHATITQESNSKTSETISLTRNDIPAITSTSSKTISNNLFTVSGTAKEYTNLILTALEPNYEPHQGVSTESTVDYELVIGSIFTNDDGTWSIDIPVTYAGNYLFTVYENYGESSQISSNQYSYELNFEEVDIQLMVAPSPYNPTEGTLKIQYQLSKNSETSIAIYSISGHKIYESTGLSGSSGGLKGQNTLVWNGTYNGNKVAPGLYVVILKVGSNESAIIKTKRLGVKW